MSDNRHTTFEAMWGHELLDSGFLQAPNLLVRFYKELGMTNGEFSLVLQILSHKYDGRDPYPSQDLLAAYQKVSDTRHIRRMIDSLEKKGLVLVGVRKDAEGRRMHNIYNFSPLVNKLEQKAAKLKAEIAKRNEGSSTVVWRQKAQGTKRPANTNPADQNSPVDADQNDPVDTGHNDPLEADQKNPPNNTQQNTKQDAVVVDSQIAAKVIRAVEQELGESITSLRSLVPGWIEQHGARRLLDCARYVKRYQARTPIRALRSAVEKNWSLQEGGHAENSAGDRTYDDYVRSYGPEDQEWHEKYAQGVAAHGPKLANLIGK